MNKLIELAQQHVRESEARLRHIDERMALARPLPATASALKPADSSERRVPQPDVVEQRRPRSRRSEVATRHEGLQGAIETVGVEFEKALAAVLEAGHSAPVRRTLAQPRIERAPPSADEFTTPD